MLNPNNPHKKPKDPMKRLNSMKNNYNLSNAFGGKIVLGDSQTKTKIVEEPKQVKRKDNGVTLHDIMDDYPSYNNKNINNLRIN